MRGIANGVKQRIGKRKVEREEGRRAFASSLIASDLSKWFNATPEMSLAQIHTKEYSGILGKLVSLRKVQ